MVAPTPAVRAETYARDMNRCVRCRSTDLSYQHRQAGGGNVAPEMVDGLTACLICNYRFEADLQLEALVNGWKVRRWVKDKAGVPVNYVQERQWYVLTTSGRAPISAEQAMTMMHEMYGEQYDQWASNVHRRGK